LLRTQRRPLAGALLTLALPACSCGKLIPIEKSENFAPVLREIQDIKDFLHSYLFEKSNDPWEHRVTVRKKDPATGGFRDVVVDRTELLDALVLNDPAVFHAVTSDVNRPVGVAQAYTRLKGVVDNLRMRKNLAELKLVGEVDGKQVGGSGEPPEDLEFVDALIHHADALQIEQLETDKPNEEGQMPSQVALRPSVATEAPKRRETMPVYLSRQRCEVCTTVIMRKLAGAPHLCAGMEYYFDSCNDALVSILHWYTSVMFWMQGGGCHKAMAGGGYKWMKPCAPHVVCSWIISPNYHIPFCPWDGRWRAPGVEDNLLPSEFPHGSPKAAIAYANTLSPEQKQA
jgi:hypothetical protein